MPDSLKCHLQGKWDGFVSLVETPELIFLVRLD